MRLRLASLLVLLSIASAVARATAPTQWLQVHTDHFVIVTDSDARDARRTAAQFERMRSVFHRLLPTSMAENGAPITVVALRDHKGFEALEPPEYLAKHQLQLAGLFLGGADRNFILVRLDAPRSEFPYATIYHEYTHVLNAPTRWLPLWLNEGLAEFFQNTEIDDRDVRLGQPSAGDIQYLRSASLLPLTTLFAVDHSSPYYHDEQKGSVFYSESWALTHLLIVTDRQANTHRLSDYEKLLEQGEDPVTAGEHAFGDLKKLQALLADYIQRNSFSFFKVPTDVHIEESKLAVDPLPEAESEAIRAEVLGCTGRSQEADALIADATRAEPKNAFIQEALGYLRLRENKMSEAQQAYAQAVQLGSTSFLAHFESATLSFNDPGSDASTEAGFRTAIKLAPTFAPAWSRLADFFASRHRNLDEARLDIVKAAQLDPGNLDYRMDFANILLEQNAPGAAKNAASVLKFAMRLAHTPQDKAMVQSRLDRIHDFQQTQEADAAAPSQGPVRDRTHDGAAAANPNLRVDLIDGRSITRDGTKIPHFPATPATGPRHTVNGVLKNVQCYEPSVLTVTVTHQGTDTVLYSNDFYTVDFYTKNFQPKGDLHPCSDIESMKASVEYADVKDDNASGQMIKVELSR